MTLVPRYRQARGSWLGVPGLYWFPPLNIMKGRFPSNLLISDDILNNGKNYKPGGNKPIPMAVKGRHYFNGTGKIEGMSNAPRQYTDKGSYSRYFSLDAWWKRHNV